MLGGNVRLDGGKRREPGPAPTADQVKARGKASAAARRARPADPTPRSSDRPPNGDRRAACRRPRRSSCASSRPWESPRTPRSSSAACRAPSRCVRPAPSSPRAPTAAAPCAAAPTAAASCVAASCAAAAPCGAGACGRLVGVFSATRALCKVMERATDVVGAEVDPMWRPRLIIGLSGTANKYRLVAQSKLAVKQAHQLTRIE